MNETGGRVTSLVLSPTRSLLVALTVLLVPSLYATERMPLDEVRKGMKGYGLTVFEGTTIEKFDVEIVGVLRNIAPGQNIILANVDSPVVRRAGVIAGMSGSPVFIDGKVIGALAFAWQFAKEPVAGITPIEEMLQISRIKGTPAGSSAAAAPRLSTQGLLDALSRQELSSAFEAMMSGLPESVQVASGARRIALPVSLSSFESETVARFSPYLERMGFVTTAAGSNAKESVSTPAAFRPGDAVGAVLLNGDFNVAATGTVTYVDGDHVYAFGHPFLDMGEIEFPMATSEVVGVLPSLASSFKFSNTGNVVGVLRQDRAAGIMGVVGQKPATIPVSVTIKGADPAEKTFHVNLVRHSNLSPLMLAMVADSIVATVQRTAGERTVLLDSEIQLKGFPPIELREGWAGAQARQSIPQYLAVVAGYLMSNEFRATDIEQIRITLHHDDELRIARLLEANVETPDRGYIVAGDTLTVRALLKPFRGEPFTETLKVRVPEDQPEGSAYVLVSGGTGANAVDFSLVPPDPRNLEQVIEVLRRLRASTDLTVGLYSTRAGAVSAGVYLPSLPPSIRAVVGSDSSNSGKTEVKYHPAAHAMRHLDQIVDGMLKININVQPAI
jgi:hypothetical protein